MSPYRKAISRADVAELAGVSLAAVSQVLNNNQGHRISAETQNKIRLAAEQLGYRPSSMAMAIKTGRTGNIGVLLCNTHDIFSPYTSGLLNGIWEALYQGKYRMLVDNLPEDGDASIMFRDKAIDGILLLAPSDGVQQVERMVEANFPVVSVGNRTNVPTHFFDMDNQQCAINITQRMIKYGHQRIAMLCGPVHSMSSARERLEGFRLCMQKNSLNIEEDWIIPSEYTRESGECATQVLLRAKQGYSAIFCASDAIARGAMDILGQQGIKVPLQISLACVASTAPTDISSMVQDTKSIGRAAAEFLIQTIKRPASAVISQLLQGQWMPGETLQERPQTLK